MEWRNELPTKVDIPGATEKKYIRLHMIKKIETKIVAVVQLMFASGEELRASFLEELKILSDKLSELESDDF